MRHTLHSDGPTPSTTHVLLDSNDTLTVIFVISNLCSMTTSDVDADSDTDYTTYAGYVEIGGEKDDFP